MFSEPQWGSRLAWSRLVDLGSIDSGSNPGSPTTKFLLILVQILSLALSEHVVKHSLIPRSILTSYAEEMIEHAFYF
jgi:hypothetical protein